MMRLPLSEVVAELRDVRARLRRAEDEAAALERALASSRRIGMAVGILMCRHQLTDEAAFGLLREHSQRTNTKVRDLAETVIYTGTLEFPA
jgi:AmiR/NasT family two-component response regulator